MARGNKSRMWRAIKNTTKMLQNAPYHEVLSLRKNPAKQQMLKEFKELIGQLIKECEVEDESTIPPDRS